MCQSVVKRTDIVLEFSPLQCQEIMCMCLRSSTFFHSNFFLSNYDYPITLRQRTKRERRVRSTRKEMGRYGEEATSSGGGGG